MRAQNHRIVTNSSVLPGKPTVKGTEIPVDSILSHLAENPDLNDLFAAYPGLTLEDVKAVLAYARDAVSHDHSSGTSWLKDLYNYFGPVREEAERKGYSEEEIDSAIDRAVAAVRAEHA
jgi:uncharacterized protein (DUF433 family)